MTVSCVIQTQGKRALNVIKSPMHFLIALIYYFQAIKTVCCPTLSISQLIMNIINDDITMFPPARIKPMVVE